MERQARVVRYRDQNQQVDQLVLRSEKRKALDLLRSLMHEAATAGDEDYCKFFESELVGYSSEDFVKAIQLLKESIVVAQQIGGCPDSFLLCNLGACYGLKGDPHEAINWFDKALEADPRNWNAMRQKGVSLSKKGDIDAAIESFKKALAENPRDWDAMRQIGVSLSKKGDDDAAIECFDRALAENPRDWHSMREKGLSLSKKSNFNAAVESFDKALIENPNDWTAMRQKGVTLSLQGDMDGAIRCYDEALAVNPRDSWSMRNKGVALFNKGDKEAAMRYLGVAAKMKPDRWEQEFRAFCKLAGRDAGQEWVQLVGNAGAGLLQAQDALEELRLLINTIRTRLEEQATKYLDMKRKEELRLAEFLQPESRFVKDRALLMVLRKWNSYTPALPASTDDERSRGGGYFIWHNGHGTVVDPGFNFIENFHQAGGRVCDIHNIILTHAHADHTAEFETLRTLLFEYNDNIREINKERVKQTPARPPLPLKRVRFFFNNGAFRKFAGMLDLRDQEFTDRVITLNRDCEFDLLGGGRLRVLPAYHDELLSRDQSVGILFTLGTQDNVRRILLTSDTGLFPLQLDTRKPTADTSQPESEIGRQYLRAVKSGDVDVMLVHIGSINPDEFDPQKVDVAQACYANHLGIIGTARVIAMCQPQLAVISEFGEEMRSFRFDLIRDLRDTVLRLYFEDRGGCCTQVVPGDLAFVYSIMDGSFLDCASRDWSPADRIDFWEDSAGDETCIYYAKDVSADKKVRRKHANLFREHRRECDGLYFGDS